MFYEYEIKLKLMPDFFNLTISLIPSEKKDLYVKGLKKTQRKE